MLVQNAANKIIRDVQNDQGVEMHLKAEDLVTFPLSTLAAPSVVSNLFGDGGGSSVRSSLDLGSSDDSSSTSSTLRRTEADVPPRPPLLATLPEADPSPDNPHKDDEERTSLLPASSAPERSGQDSDQSRSRSFWKHSKTSR